jgi:hypothetical protein
MSEPNKTYSWDPSLDSWDLSDIPSTSPLPIYFDVEGDVILIIDEGGEIYAPGEGDERIELDNEEVGIMLREWSKQLTTKINKS